MTCGVLFNFLVNEEQLKKRIAEELALEQARRDAEAHKRFVFGINGSFLYIAVNWEIRGLL